MTRVPGAPTLGSVRVRHVHKSFEKMLIRYSWRVRGRASDPSRCRRSLRDSIAGARRIATESRYGVIAAECCRQARTVWVDSSSADGPQIDTLTVGNA